MPAPGLPKQAERWCQSCVGSGAQFEPFPMVFAPCHMEGQTPLQWERERESFWPAFLLGLPLDDDKIFSPTDAYRFISYDVDSAPSEVKEVPSRAWRDKPCGRSSSSRSL